MQIDGNVIVCDSIDERGIGILKNAGLLVEYLPEISNQELITKVKDYDCTQQNENHQGNHR
jgi:D-3-phosphoglycerate dehydrogenase